LYPFIKKLANSQDYQWLIKLHPKATLAEIELYRGLSSDNVQFIETGDIIPLLQAADVLLSDTSSVLAEFALQQKSVVAFNNRRPEEWMINFKQPELLFEKLESALSLNEGLLAKIKVHCEAIHPNKDGKSSERVLAAINEMVKSGTQHLKAKPLNLMRRLKMRNKLKYYRWK
jgi:CDP-glycerol glycerophosphotransferase (TagB/SpsB family)